jgi:hypothetical protein
MNVQFDDAVLLCAFHDAFTQSSAADFRKQRGNINSHRLRGSLKSPELCRHD